MHATWIWLLAVVWHFRSVVLADPGRDQCKIYKGGLKCSHMVFQYFPYDAFLSFNDDIARFTTEMKFLQIENSNITVLQSRSFQRTPRLSHLVLTHIQLQQIEQGAFDGLNRLKFADLSHNSIQTIPVDTFKHTKILRLNLNGNKFLILPDSAPFLSAPHLTWLSLKGCNLRQLSQLSLSELPALVHLDLSENRLKALPTKIFSPLANLNFLNFSSNRLEELDLELFQSVPTYPKRPSVVYLGDNPFVCNCQIVKVVAWMTGNRIAGHSTVSCRKPELKSTTSGWFREFARSCQQHSALLPSESAERVEIFRSD